MPDSDAIDEDKTFANLTSDQTIAWLEEILEFAKAHRGEKVIVRDYADQVLDRLAKRGFVKP